MTLFVVTVQPLAQEKERLEESRAEVEARVVELERGMAESQQTLSRYITAIEEVGQGRGAARLRGTMPGKVADSFGPSLVDRSPEISTVAS